MCNGYYDATVVDAIITFQRVLVKAEECSTWLEYTKGEVIQCTCWKCGHKFDVIGNGVIPVKVECPKCSKEVEGS